MDLYSIIDELYDERERLNGVIHSLELLAEEEKRQASTPTKRRGRKSMSQEERRIVSQRMRKYWAQRRKK